MTDAWSFRPGTLDQSIFDGVVALDEYRLPERFEPGDVVGLETFRKPVLVERDDAVEDHPIERAGSEAPRLGHRSASPARAEPR